MQPALRVSEGAASSRLAPSSTLASLAEPDCGGARLVRAWHVYAISLRVPPCRSAGACVWRAAPSERLRSSRRRASAGRGAPRPRFLVSRPEGGVVCFPILFGGD